MSSIKDYGLPDWRGRCSHQFCSCISYDFKLQDLWHLAQLSADQLRHAIATARLRRDEGGGGVEGLQEHERANLILFLELCVYKMGIGYAHCTEETVIIFKIVQNDHNLSSLSAGLSTEKLLREIAINGQWKNR